MRYKSGIDMKAHGFLGKCWYIAVVVFNTYDNGDDTCASEAVYWDDGTDTHPFECAFDNYDEAKAYASTFSPEMVAWTHANGNGPEWQHVSVDIVETYFDGDDFYNSDARCMFSWWDAKELEIIEFDENWHQIMPTD